MNPRSMHSFPRDAVSACVFHVLFLAATVSAAERPNIIVIMVDDMGFSDIGPWGSEIPTPRLDELAHGGVRFSQFREERYRRRSSRTRSAGWELEPRPEEVPAWESLPAEERQRYDDMMAIYAAMIVEIDRNIGKLVDALRERDQLDNTLILFLSDNGGNAQRGAWELFDLSTDRTEQHNLAEQHPDEATALAARWREWAREAHVIPKPRRNRGA